MKTCILIISCVVAVLLASTMVSNAQEKSPCPPNFYVVEEACVNMGPPDEDGHIGFTPSMFQAYCRDMSVRGHARPEPLTSVCAEGQELWVCCGVAEKPTP